MPTAAIGPRPAPWGLVTRRCARVQGDVDFLCGPVRLTTVDANLGINSMAREDTMKTMILAAVAAAGILSVASLTATAMPVDGAAIARIGQQVDPTVTVATKKKKHKTTTSTTAPAKNTEPCPTNQERSNRTGFCIPAHGDRG
jgi:hypothetical protein